MTIDIADQIEVMKAALAGKQIQHRKRTGLNGTQWSIPTYFAINYQFDFKTFEYRIYEPPKKVKYKAYLAAASLMFFTDDDDIMDSWKRLPQFDVEVEE